MSPSINENVSPDQLYQDKKCQYCGKEFNTKSNYWKKFCSVHCRQNQYVFNKTGRKPMSHAQVDSAALSFGEKNDEHKIQVESFQIFTTNNKLPSIADFVIRFSAFFVRSLLKIISPISNILLRANRFLVERGAV